MVRNKVKFLQVADPKTQHACHAYLNALKVTHVAPGRWRSGERAGPDHLRAWQGEAVQRRALPDSLPCSSCSLWNNQMQAGMPGLKPPQPWRRAGPEKRGQSGLACQR